MKGELERLATLHGSTPPPLLVRLRPTLELVSNGHRSLSNPHASLRFDLGFIYRCVESEPLEQKLAESTYISKLVMRSGFTASIGGA